ncbi:hypothetical protein DEFDS_0669 [Deferribacter desulfuricans SSM1]|uniref:DUF5666 domain-containing protein n=1 Tax=Deferribacter desulfuricans (strain DSM 14783 / JCM 11476 / NBRC 101012 / SSM1) TaxID=639282 RepID=D3PC26_DEFDS|nr:hypothetical protein [Deferribacter desulfuricans]BAI80149.1 hypothetical protein DEFDS_0669 [Deferribacter desulfuricans SSM1]
MKKKVLAFILAVSLVSAVVSAAVVVCKGTVIGIKGNKVLIKVEDDVTKLKKGDAVTIKKGGSEDSEELTPQLQGC